MKRENNICFTDSQGNALFTIPDGGMIKLRAAELPMGAREGDVLKWEPEGWKVDREETERRRESVRKKLESLIE